MGGVSRSHSLAGSTTLNVRAVTLTALAGVTACVLALGGCTSAPEASPGRDAEVKRFISNPGSAGVYVYRPDLPNAETEGQSVLWIDGRLIGQTLPRTYFRVDLRAGAHELRGDGPEHGRLMAKTSAGELYFVRLNVVGGTMRFAAVDAETGKREILRCCVLLENWAPGQRPFLR